MNPTIEEQLRDLQAQYELILAEALAGRALRDALPTMIATENFEVLSRAITDYDMKRRATDEAV